MVDRLESEHMQCKCKKKMYPYTDGLHSIFICFACGRFEGVSGGDTMFMELVTRDPLILLELIETKELRPM